MVRICLSNFVISVGSTEDHFVSMNQSSRGLTELSEAYQQEGR